MSAKGVLEIYERVLDLAPKDAFKFYATETMRRHKPVVESTLAMLPTWLKADAPPREFICLQLKDGAEYRDAARIKFDVLGYEPKSKLFGKGPANVLSVGLSTAEDAETATTLRALFVEVCRALPIQSGLAGFSLECSKYDQETSQTHAVATGMRHQALDICRITDDSLAVANDGIKGVGWLTAIGSELVAQIGGARQIKKSVHRDVEITEAADGLILQAGAAPVLGDVNKGGSLAAYRSVYRLIAPYVRRAAERSPSFNLATDYVARTEHWFTRLEK